MSLNDRPISTWFTRFAYGRHWAANHSETRAPTLDIDDTRTNEKGGGDARSTTSSVTVRLAGDRDIGADGSDRRRHPRRATTARNSLSTRADSRPAGARPMTSLFGCFNYLEIRSMAGHYSIIPAPPVHVLCSGLSVVIRATTNSPLPTASSRLIGAKFIQMFSLICAPCCRIFRLITDIIKGDSAGPVFNELSSCLTGWRVFRVHSS